MSYCQGKEEFEKNQRQLLEKGNIIRQKTQLEQQQVRNFWGTVTINNAVLVWKHDKYCGLFAGTYNNSDNI